jgi:hypothetical protein
MRPRLVRSGCQDLAADAAHRLEYGVQHRRPAGSSSRSYDDERRVELAPIGFRAASTGARMPPTYRTFGDGRARRSPPVRRRTRSATAPTNRTAPVQCVPRQTRRARRRRSVRHTLVSAGAIAGSGWAPAARRVATPGQRHTARAGGDPGHNISGLPMTTSGRHRSIAAMSSHDWASASSDPGVDDAA